MANIFNEFFTSMPSKLLQISILLTQIMFLILSNIYLLMTQKVQFLFLVSPQEVNNAANLLSPKKSQDMNCVSLLFLKKFIYPLATTSAHVFSCLLNNGCVPVQLKNYQSCTYFKIF
jgi:hypothetical protein